MKQTLTQYPVLSRLIPTIEQLIEQQVPTEMCPDFLTRLKWLKVLAESK